MNRVPVSRPDAPTELRAWGADTDPAEERAARTHLKAGFPLSVVVPDVDCTYTLAVWPVRVPGRPEPHGSPHRVGGFAHPVYLLATQGGR
ncbi:MULTISPECIES: hypothetical protein [unclassified Streptomyces]|uniref:hypothetical protein n=1 Tax=unclassified Streptomyces TaxID=2593676 RepID=UPI0022B6ACCB|nr:MULTISPECIES: hypothetical protein [unclassified Streptomyces]MCZ7415426.1 hypothetical protein [Streptomyces sp. WMMC897]MCZ7417840.1 hypothetical protein [Streptomyces sp. WMMC897]MCZ7417866.1 hypothetical protein [Streptomyces sp. WMMC897]MCZ7432355.1 hypothetical protein [Streptomyces sp. WMMC1477]